MDHSPSTLGNPLTFAFMAMVGCTVGHTLMAPLGLFELSAQIGQFFTELTGNALNLSTIFASSAADLTTTSIAQPITQSFCHLHGAELVCH